MSSDWNRIKTYLEGGDSNKPTHTNVSRALRSIDLTKILYVKKGLENQELPPNSVMVAALDHFSSNAYLLLFALALRNGANANMYVNAPRIGNVHVLAFLHIKAEELNISKNNQGKLIAMLLMSGSKPSRPVFQPSNSSSFEDKTTQQWIRDQGYATILHDVADGLDALTPEFLTKVGTYLNLPGQVYMENVDPYTAVEYYSNAVLTSYLTPQRLDWELADNIVNRAIQRYNTGAINGLLSKGYVPHYVQINEMLLLAYRNKNQGLLVNLAKSMVVSSVGHGATLDTEQLSLAKMIGDNFASDVQNAYQKPYWKKACKSEQDLFSDKTAELRELSYNLHLNPEHSKKALCNSIQEISQADPSSLVQAIEKKQKEKITDTVGYPQEFVNANPSILCQNGKNEMYQYNDLDVAVYRDSNGSTWCFTRDVFDSLLKNKVNPYTEEALPETFLTKLSARREMLQELGVKGSDLQTIQDTLKSLQNKDSVSDSKSKEVLDKFYRLAASRGISKEYIDDLTNQQMESLLSLVNVYVELTPLTHRHALITLAHAALRKFQRHPGTTKYFFQNMELQRSSK